MKRSYLTLTASLACLFVAGAFALAQQDKEHEHKKEEKKQEARKLPDCPVMGDTVNLAVRTETDSGPVYFCCDHCIGKYQKDPKKYEKEVKEQREILHKLPAVQTTCPISGKPVDAEASIEEGGHKVFFCCKKCPETYKKDPAKYAGKLAAAFTYQTKCPVSGEDIDAAVSTKTADGHVVYFCCGKCMEKFEADPEKYGPKLEEQGYKLKLKKKTEEKKK